MMDFLFEIQIFGLLFCFAGNSGFMQYDSPINQSLFVKEGETVRLPCTIAGKKKENQTVSWKQYTEKNYQFPIQDKSNSVNNIRVLKEENYTLVFANFSSSLNGIYLCHLEIVQYHLLDSNFTDYNGAITVQDPFPGSDFITYVVGVKEPPMVESIDGNTMIELGKTLKLKCVTTGFPIYITWYKQKTSTAEKESIPNRRNSIYIWNVNDKVSGIYSCEVSYNNEKNSKSVTVFVFPDTSNGLLSQLINQTLFVKEEERVTLPCTITEKKEENQTVSWVQKTDVEFNTILDKSDSVSNIRMLKEENYALVISNFSSYSNGIYMCLLRPFKNPFPGSDFITYVVGVKESLMVNLIRGNTMIQVGQHLRLVCECKDFPLSNITWYKQKNSTAEKESIPYNDKWIFIEEVSDKDSGIYSCEVSHNNEKNSKSVSVVVLPDNGLLPQLINQTLFVEEEERVTLPCTIAKNKEENRTVSWVQKTDVEFNTILDKSDSVSNIRMLEEENYALVISNFSSYSNGIYMCLLLPFKNPFPGSDFITYVVAVKESLMVKSMGGETIIEEGDDLKLFCEYNDFPLLNITWYKQKNSTAEKESIPNQYHWIHTEKVSDKDSGIYSCEVSYNNEKNSKSLTVVVLPGLKAESKHVYTAVPPGEFTKLCCLMNNTKKVIWLKEGVEISLDDRIVKEDTENKSCLKFQQVESQDFGTYSCHDNNYSKRIVTINLIDNSTTTHITNAEGKGSTVLSVPIVIGSTCLLFMIGAVSTMYVCYKLKKARRIIEDDEIYAAALRSWVKVITIEMQSNSSNNSQEPLNMPIVKIQRKKVNNPFSMMEYQLPLDKRWEFARENLKLREILGEGAFGKVLKGEANAIMRANVISIVAVKMLKDNYDDQDMTDLVTEMEIMKMIGKHKNIIRFLGCCSQRGELLIIMEYALHGNLRNFLRQHRPNENEPCIEIQNENNLITYSRLLSFACQVAKGMEYLASRRFVHRDLAARNILVFENHIIKIADFGLAREIQYGKDYYKKSTNCKLPIKWMAPETLLHGTFTSQADVWSYGVLLWEIITLGGAPYPSIPRLENLLELLNDGYRMEKPSSCSQELYDIMCKCWNLHPTERPKFSNLTQSIDEILMETNSEEYLNVILSEEDASSTQDQDIADNDLVNE